MTSTHPPRAAVLPRAAPVHDGERHILPHAGAEAIQTGGPPASISERSFNLAASMMGITISNEQ